MKRKQSLGFRTAKMHGLSLALAGGLIFSGFLTAQAEIIQEGGLLFEVNPDYSNAVLIGWDEEDPEVLIPSMVEYEETEYTVTEFISDVFREKGVESVTFPETITEIPQDAFFGCYNLQTVNLPSNLSMIGAFAFYNCNALSTIDFPANLEVIYEYAFANSGLTSLTYPVSADLQAYVFQNCELLTSLEIPEGVTNIGPGMFSGCISLTKVDFPASLEQIFGESFYETSLRNVYLPTGLQYLGSNAFGNCELLQVVGIGNAIPAVENAFYGSHIQQLSIVGLEEPFDIRYLLSNCLIEKLVYSRSTSEIWDGAFADCNIVTAQFDYIESIGESAFIGCANLTEITLPESLTTIGNSAFAYCQNLQSINLPNSLQYLGPDAFSECYNLSDVTIPTSLTTINDGTFRGTGLTTITIPENIEYIGYEAFANCYTLNEVIVESITPPTIVWSAFNNVYEYAVLKCPAALIYSTAENWSQFLNVTCSENYMPTSVSLPQSVEIPAQSGYSLFSGHNPLNIEVTPSQGLYNIEWRSSNQEAAYIDRGMLRTQWEGNTELSAYVYGTDQLLASCELTVTPSNISIYNQDISIKPGEVYQNDYSYWDKDAEFFWTNSNPSVAYINETGLIVSMGVVGSTVITANYGDETKDIYVEVSEDAINNYEISWWMDVNSVSGDPLMINARLNGGCKDMILWESLTPEIATVNHGIVTILRAGENAAFMVKSVYTERDIIVDYLGEETYLMNDGIVIYPEHFSDRHLYALESIEYIQVAYEMSLSEVSSDLQATLSINGGEALPIPAEIVTPEGSENSVLQLNMSEVNTSSLVGDWQITLPLGFAKTNIGYVSPTQVFNNLTVLDSQSPVEITPEQGSYPNTEIPTIEIQWPENYNLEYTWTTGTEVYATDANGERWENIYIGPRNNVIVVEFYQNMPGEYNIHIPAGAFYIKENGEIISLNSEVNVTYTITGMPNAFIVSPADATLTTSYDNLDRIVLEWPDSEIEYVDAAETLLYAQISWPTGGWWEGAGVNIPTEIVNNQLILDLENATLVDEREIQISDIMNIDIIILDNFVKDNSKGFFNVRQDINLHVRPVWEGNIMATPEPGTYKQGEISFVEFGWGSYMDPTPNAEPVTITCNGEVVASLERSDNSLWWYGDRFSFNFEDLGLPDGEYVVNIPEGLARISEYEGYISPAATFTYVISGSMNEATVLYPLENPQYLENIFITWDQPVTRSDRGYYSISIYDENDNYVTSAGQTPVNFENINEWEDCGDDYGNAWHIWLYEPPIKAGKYHFTIEANSAISEDGLINPRQNFEFEITGFEIPEPIITPAEGYLLEPLKDVVIRWTGCNVDFYNTSGIVVSDGSNVLPSNINYLMVDEDWDYQAICITLEEEVSSPGTYRVYIPANSLLINMDGARVWNETMEFSYTIPEPFEAPAATSDPADGSTVKTIQKVTISWDGMQIQLNEDCTGEVVFTVDNKVVNDETIRLTLNADSDELTISLDDEYFEPGTYAFAIPEGLVIVTDDVTGQTALSGAFTLTFIVDDITDGVFGISKDANGLFNVYNTNGVMILSTKDAGAVKRLEKGIYVINGKKIRI